MDNIDPKEQLANKNEIKLKIYAFMIGFNSWVSL